jgi:hypothetical protein
MISDILFLGGKNSIARYLLNIVFSIYVLIALFLTAIQISAEMLNSKNLILQDLQTIHNISEASLARSVWLLNLTEINYTPAGNITGSFCCWC